MPHHRFDWHEHIKDVEDEYRAARFALNELSTALEQQSGLLRKGGLVRAHLRKAHANLEGTYLVRLFASFEAALRNMKPLTISTKITKLTMPIKNRKIRAGARGLPG